jgi:hypothetical protein
MKIQTTTTSSGALITDRPTMADVAGPKEGYISLKEYEDMQRNNMYDFTKSPGMRNRPKEEIEQTIKDIVSAASKDPDNYLRNYRGNFDSIISNRLASNGTTNQTASVNSLGPSKYSANATKSFDEFLKDEGIVPDTVNYNGEPGRYMGTDGTVVDIDNYKDMYDGSYGTPNQTVSLNSMSPATYGTTEEEDLNLALGLSPGKAVTTAMDAARKYGPSIASFIFSGGLTGPAEAMRAGAKQVAASKVSDALSERILGNLTQQVARENQSSNTGGYQSSWGGVSDFMSGSGTSADMGSFKKGGSVKKSIRERIINLVGGPSAAAAELGLEGILQIYDLLGMPLFAKGGLAKNKLTDTVPPEKGPDSQGVESLFRRK